MIKEYLAKMQQYHQEEIRSKLDKVNRDLQLHCSKTNLQPYYKPNISLDTVSYDVNLGSFSNQIRTKGYFVVDNFFNHSVLYEINNFLLTHPYSSASDSGVHHLNVPFCKIIVEDVIAVYRDLENYELDKSFFTLHWYDEPTALFYNRYDGIKLEVFLTPTEHNLIESLGGIALHKPDNSFVSSTTPFYTHVDYKEMKTNIEGAPFYDKYIGYKFNRAVFTDYSLVTSSPDIRFENEVHKAKKSINIFLKKKT